MSTRSVTYNGVVGLKFVQSSILSNTTIYGVKREGLGYNEGVGIPGNREFVYASADGKISFENEFSDVEEGGRSRPEKVWILFKL